MRDLTPLAKELHGELWTYNDWDLLAKEEKQEWLILAKHVAKMVLEAQIEEVYWGMTVDSERLDNIRIVDLQQQLTELS